MNRLNGSGVWGRAPGGAESGIPLSRLIRRAERQWWMEPKTLEEGEQGGGISSHPSRASSEGEMRGIYPTMPPGRPGYVSVCRHVPTVYMCCSEQCMYTADPLSRLIRRDERRRARGG